MAAFDLAKWREEGARRSAELKAAGFVAPGPRTLKPKDSAQFQESTDSDLTTTGGEDDGKILGVKPWVLGLGLGGVALTLFVAYQLTSKAKAEKK